MRGPRSIAESVTSTQGGRWGMSTTASLLSLNIDYGSIKPEDSLMRIGAKRGEIGAMGLTHRPSTLAMVDKYERMCTPPMAQGQCSQRRYGGGSRPPAIPHKDTFQGTTNKKDKNRSPLRQSIRNFLSTLKKGATKSGDSSAKAAKTTVGDHPPRIPDKDRGLDLRKINYENEGNVCPPSSQASRSDRRVEFSGPVWFLSYGPPAAWIMCTGVVETRKMAITWFSSNDVKPCTLEIDLGGCIDVRSLATPQLDAEELALLSRHEETRELRVFELVLQGRERRKFAVRNLGERAAWVSALWDAILPTESVGSQQFPSQEQLARRPGYPNKPETRPSLTGAHQEVYKGNPNTITASERSLPALPHTPRMLAPITIPSTSLISKVEIMPRIDSARTPVSPSIYSPLRTPSRSPSPSIMNLEQRSVVKQRLEQIQREEEQRAGSPCSQKTRKGISSHSLASTTGTGRSGFLSVLTTEGGVGEEDTGGRVPFEHLEQVDRADHTRPGLERNNTARSELPYTGDEFIDESPDASKTKMGHLQTYLEPLSRDLAAVKTVLGGEAGQPSLHQVLLGVDNQSRAMKQSVEQMVRRIESLQDHSSDFGSPHEDIRQALEAVRSDLTNRVREATEQLKQIAENQVAAKFQQTLVEPGSQPLSNLHEVISGITKANYRVDAVLSNHSPSTEGQVKTSDSADRALLVEMTKVRELIENDNGKRALQVQQQADSVRYLNELNSWLENFVQNGTVQINSLAANVEQLCRDLGSLPGSTNENMLCDIHATVLELKHLVGASSLQGSVDKLAETLNVSSQNSLNMQALVSFMERQRREQENFLRTFTTEISGEIKGERLRFVEAMKEATVINIQGQVDQLRKELAQQIVTAAQDLGRLESEKRAVETRIADLHAFHIKQKQASREPVSLTVTATRPTYQPLSQQPQYSANVMRNAYQYGRPLPHPRHR